MKYYQTDFLARPPKLERESVKLFLSSVPIYILKDDYALLFGLLKRFMRPDGWILIDAPAGYRDYTINLDNIGRAVGWKLSSRMHLLPKFYKPDEDQIIYVHYNTSAHVNQIMSQFRYRKIQVARQREMAHPCEFCPDVIRLLIDAYSDEGDIVLDPFCGTGTVPGEADAMGRHGIGCDLRPYENIRNEYL